VHLKIFEKESRLRKQGYFPSATFHKTDAFKAAAKKRKQGYYVKMLKVIEEKRLGDVYMLWLRKK
jgi:hypothetical protein